MTATALLSAVLADPFDDAPRLVYADWLDENEEQERAEFIRYQIWKPVRPPYGGWGCQCGVPNAHPPCNECLNVTEEDVQKSDNANAVLRNWDQQYYDAYSKCRNFEYEETAEIGGVKVKIIYRRGFPDEIRCTMREWCGQLTCRDCDGKGDYLHPTYYRQPCKPCNGTGRTPGIAKAACEAWPVTKVVLVDRQPAIMDKEYGWYVTDRDSIPSTIPMELWSLLPVKWAKTQAEALAALSCAALNYGRRLAGLPEHKQG